MEENLFYDLMGMLKQIGVIPAKRKRRRDEERFENERADAGVVHRARESHECAAGKPLHRAVGSHWRNPAQTQIDTLGARTGTSKMRLSPGGKSFAARRYASTWLPIRS